MITRWNSSTIDDAIVQMGTKHITLMLNKIVSNFELWCHITNSWFHFYMRLRALFRCFFFLLFLAGTEISIIIMKRAKKWRNCNLCGSDWMINANTILTRFFVSQYSHACACAISLHNLLLVFFWLLFLFYFLCTFCF